MQGRCPAVITAPGEIQTPRLTLRKPVRADAAEIFRQYAGDPEVTRCLDWRPDGSLRQVEELIDTALAHWEEGTSFAWSVILRESGAFLGTIEARIDAYMVNVSYVIARPHWNRGYATEALRGLCAWADGEPEVFRVWAVCAADNPASARVLEKAGMTREGMLRRWTVFPNRGGAPVDCYSYARVRETSAGSSPPGTV